MCVVDVDIKSAARDIPPRFYRLITRRLEIHPISLSPNAFGQRNKAHGLAKDYQTIKVRSD